MAYRIKATGRVYPYRAKPADCVLVEIGDMLRYDEGDVESISLSSTPGSSGLVGPGGMVFTAIVITRRYTKDRWDRFGIRTELVETLMKVAPEARFKSPREVSEFIYAIREKR